MTMTRRQNRRAGFTLIEVLLVIGLLLVLGTVGVVSYQKIQAGADKQLAQAKVDQVEQAVKLYEQAMRTVPETDEGLEALYTEPDDEDKQKMWTGPYLEDKEIPKDPWGEEIKYSVSDGDDGSVWHVYSCGPNREDDSGTGDDIPAWAEED